MIRVLFILLFAFQSCVGKSNTSAEKHLIGIDEFSKAIQDTNTSVQLVDVRTPEEFAQGHIPDAKNFDWRGQHFDLQIANLDKSRPVYLYCMSGGRSASAAEKLKHEGFEVYELEGGILSWRYKKLPETVNSATDQGMSIEQYQLLLQDSRLILVDFYAKWCAPCKKMKPYFDNISAEMNDRVKVVRIDIDENRELARQLQIIQLPGMKLYKDQKIIWEHDGYLEEEQIREQLGL